MALSLAVAAPTISFGDLALAQSTSPALRPTQGAPAANPSDGPLVVPERNALGPDGGAGTTTRNVADASRLGDPRRPPRPTSRRTRNPTAAEVRPVVRTPSTNPAVAPNVQPPQVGIPDPAVDPYAFARKKPRPEDDPYAQLGIRGGNVMFYPSIGESVGYDTNPNRINGFTRKGSFVSQTEAEMRVQSDWSVHELSGFVRGAYNIYPSVPEADRPEGAGQIRFRLDVSRDTTVETEAHYALDTQRFGSPTLTASVRERPVVNTEGASVALTERFNRLAVTLRGTIDRTDYSDVRQLDGTLLDLSDRAFTQFGGALRVAYEFSPGFSPFVEGFANTRSYDLRSDFAGFQRSSDGLGGRVGTTFEITRLVTGEIGVGGVQRRYDDPRLRDLTSPVAEGAITWLLSPLTTVRVGAQVGVDETTVIGSNGVVTKRGTLEIAHALWRNLTITPSLTLYHNDYRGVSITETGFNAGVKAEYKLTRWLALRASYAYEQLRSNFPGNDYTANVMLVGLRYQP